MVTLLQINRKVIIAVVVTPSICAGTGQSALPYRTPPYPARRVPNDMASPTRKTHIPSFPQLSGVRGLSYDPACPACIAAASLTLHSLPATRPDLYSPASGRASA